MKQFATIFIFLILILFTVLELTIAPWGGVILAGFILFAAFRSAKLRKGFASALLPLVLLFLISVILYFPRDHDGPKAIAASRQQQALYTYSDSIAQYEKDKIVWAKLYEDEKSWVRDFVSDYGLEKRKILDIGSGSGFMQDIVSDYTGLDIQSGYSPLYHKPYVVASATRMPFQENSFDAAWSIFVLEHVPNPEEMLMESRRVLRNGALLFLLPAWNVPSWASQGYEVRPYNDFGLKGKIVKASIRIRENRAFISLTMMPVRLVRYLGNTMVPGPSRLRYDLLEPNVNKQWRADSDAINSLDRFEILQWFTSRGDKCLNCARDLSEFQKPLVIQIHK